MAVKTTANKKCNFTKCEIETHKGEVEKRKSVLFGGLTSGITNRTETTERLKETEAVNPHSDYKREAKKRVSAYKESIKATEGGPATLQRINA